MKETYSKLNSTQKIVANFLQQLVTECTNLVVATQPALNSLLHISRLQSLPAYYQPAPRITNPKVFYQLAIPHQQPIHRPKTDDRPNNREFKIQVRITTRTARRTDDVILDVFSKFSTSSYKFTM